MKQFAYNLAYKCENQQEADTISRYLKELGYKKYGTLEFSAENPYILNKCNGSNGSWCFNWRANVENYVGREVVSNIELFKTLCAQTLDKEFYPGELVIAIGDKKHINAAKNGSIAKVTSEKYYSNICDTNLIDVEWIKTVPENCDQQNGGYWIDYFRKMTKEEIINYVQGKQKPMEIYQDYIVEVSSQEQGKEVSEFCTLSTVISKGFYRYTPNFKGKYGLSGYSTDLEGNLPNYNKWPLITYDYWKQMVNKTNMTKKVIGYKLIKEYPNSAKLNSIVYNDLMNCSKYPEFWEPQYQEEKKTITIPCEGGSFDVELKRGEMRIGNDRLDSGGVENLWKLVNRSEVGPNTWAIFPNTWNIGCKHGVKLKDLQMLKREWDSINND